MTLKVLLAEDDRSLRSTLRDALALEGYEVLTAASLAEGLALLAHADPDLLILDLGLPRMSGLEVLRRLRARGSLLPVLILTAADSVEQRVNGFDLGADDYMAKPFALSELEARVRALTRRGQGGGSTVVKHGPLT